MITRGHLIGEIVDNISELQNQINFRSRLGLLDLNKYCEDFICEILNIIYNYKLKNVNESKSNEPAIDLGDESNRIAFQITSTATSTKVNKTLSNLTKKQKASYDTFNILILGKKQTSYSIDPKDITGIEFTPNTNIMDLLDISRAIVMLDQDKLLLVHKKFQQRIHIILSELDVPDENGEFRDSLKKKYEWAPDTIPLNALLLESLENEYSSLENVIEIFNELGKLPRVTREILELIILDGDHEGEYFQIHIDVFRRKSNIPANHLREDLDILIRAKILNYDDESGFLSTSRREILLGEILNFAFENKKTAEIIVALDFSLLDKKD